MPFINPSNPQKGGKTTKGLYLGKPEAEGENNSIQGLSNYYEDYLGIDEEISKGRFIIVGRKGVGKSAYVKHLTDNSSIDNEILCSVANSNAIYLQKIIQSIPDSIDNKACLIYEWIILTEFVKLLLSNTNLMYAKGYNELKKFEVKNSGIVNIDKWMSISETEAMNLDVNFYDLVKIFPVIFGRHLNRTTSKAPFYKIIPSLRNVVVEMLGYEANKGINYIVLFDDLDIHFDLRSNQQKEDLMELVRIARDYNVKYFPNQDIRVILMMRDDIAMHLDGVSPDKNKIFSSYEYRLQWYNSVKDAADENSKLRRLINKRIAIGLNKLGIKYDHDDPWSSLVDDTIQQEYHWKTAFKYILDCTLYRPRDLVALFEDIGNCNYHIPLSPTDVKKLIRQYVKWNAGEVKDELSNLYSSQQIESIFSFFRLIANANSEVDFECLLEYLKSKGLSEDDFDVLFEYNYLIPKDEKDRQYFSYRERFKLEDPEKYYYRLPKCLYYYFKPNLI